MAEINESVKVKYFVANNYIVINPFVLLVRRADSRERKTYGKYESFGILFVKILAVLVLEEEAQVSSVQLLSEK